MSTEVLAGLFGLSGVLVGAVLQFWLDRRRNEEARYLELKSQACADFVNSVAQLAFASPDNRPQALQAVASAKGRLCVFGDAAVIEQTAKLERAGGDLSQDEAQREFLQLLQVMRRQGIAVGQVGDDEFRVLLLAGAKSNNELQPTAGRGG